MSFMPREARRPAAVLDSLPVLLQCRRQAGRPQVRSHPGHRWLHCPVVRAEHRVQHPEQGRGLAVVPGLFRLPSDARAKSTTCDCAQVVFGYFPFPWTVSAIHVVVGTIYCWIAYVLGAKKASFGRPISKDEFKALLLPASMHAFGHIAGKNEGRASLSLV